MVNNMSLCKPNGHLF